MNCSPTFPIRVGNDLEFLVINRETNSKKSKEFLFTSPGVLTCPVKGKELLDPQTVSDFLMSNEVLNLS